MKTAIKICGVRDPNIAKQAIELGARYIGIMCYKKSKRYVTPEQGKKIADIVKTAGGIPVAVFVDQEADEMLSLCETMGVEVAQLHGSPSRRTHSQLPETIQRIYVLPVNEKGVVQPDLDQGLSKLNVQRDYIMYDSLEGGSGRTFDLSKFSHPYSLPFFLAGGLTSDNVAEMIRSVHPNVVDVSSGVEITPGVKDLNKIKKFIDAVRGTFS